MSRNSLTIPLPLSLYIEKELNREEKRGHLRAIPSYLIVNRNRTLPSEGEKQIET